MKLKDNYITQEIDGSQIMVATGNADFNGNVRSNQTAAQIINLLRNDTCVEQIIDDMMNIYEVERATVEKDVLKVIGTLRQINALEES